MKRLPVILCATLMFTAGCGPSKPTEPSKNHATTAKEPGRPKDVLTVSPQPPLAAAQLVHDYEMSAAEADQKYKGKLVQIKGEVIDVVEEGGTIFVYLAGKKGTGGTIKCGMSGRPDVKRATQVTVQGKCDGRSFLNIGLSNCTVVDITK